MVDALARSKFVLLSTVMLLDVSYGHPVGDQIGKDSLILSYVHIFCYSSETTMQQLSLTH